MLFMKGHCQEMYLRYPKGIWMLFSGDAVQLIIVVYLFFNVLT